ncbi:unnamed protein product, partial [Owenia fusiformis]
MSHNFICKKDAKTTDLCAINGNGGVTDPKSGHCYCPDGWSGKYCGCAEPTHCAIEEVNRVSCGTKTEAECILASCCYDVSSTPSCFFTDNIARGKSAFQSSDFSSGSPDASNAIDGDTNLDYSSGSCSKTAESGSTPVYWIVDLQDDYIIEKVRIFESNSDESLGNFHIDAAMVILNQSDPESSEWDRCASILGDVETEQTISCKFGVIGRYVRVRRAVDNDSTPLVLCEVKVHGQLVENVALGKTTFQSSTLSTYGSELAVDGDTNSILTGNSCSSTEEPANVDAPWWIIDLNDFYRVIRVDIFDRTDAETSRLQNYQIDVTREIVDTGNIDSVHWETCAVELYDPEDAVIAERCFSRPQARFLRIRLNYLETLTLCEVRVYGAKANVATGHVTSQSSTFGGQSSDLAIDGDTNSGGVCTQTLDEANGYWQVDLGLTYDVESVVLYNSDTNPERLSNYSIEGTVRLLDPPDTSSTQWTLCKERIGPAASMADGYVIQEFCDQRTVARWLRIRKDGVLALCEVQIEGSVVENVAKNKETFQTSLTTNEVSDNAADGDISTCSKTSDPPSELESVKWTVDLNEIHFIDTVILFIDSTSTGMSNYIIEVSPDFQTWTQCVEDTDGLDFPNSLMQIDVCQNIVEGRWIRIKLQTLTMPLVLCEVQVLAEKENNIALNKVTLQSSKDVTQDFGDSFLANDGNTDGTVLGGSCTLTNNEPEPYWIVDFGESVSIKSVVIYNRVDASAIFLTDFVVEATNALDIENNELTPWKLCARQRGGVDYGRQGQIITCPTHLMGRWLRVSLKSAGILSLCEVVVNGRDGCQVDQAECVDAIDGDISCKCREGLTGQYCNCPSDDICKYGECVDDPDGKFVCDCQRPFYGQYCGCRPGACSGHGFCTDVKGLVYTCECDAGFSGTFCACSNASCNGHGTCSSDLEKFVTCTCDAGYHGETCKCPDSTGPSCPNTSPNRKVTFTDAVQAIATQCALMLHKHAREYHAIAYFFNRDDIELPGIRFNFMQARKMEMQTKATIYELITTSGGCIVFGEVPTQEFIDVHLILHRMKISAYGARALNTAKRFLLPTASPAKERLFDWMNSWWGYIPFIHFTTDKAAIKRMLKNA